MMKKLVKAGEARSELVENFLHTEIFEIPQSCLQTKIPSLTAQNRM